MYKYHFRIATEIVTRKEDRHKYEKLSLEYYQLLRNVCSSDFSQCDAIEIYKNSVYAADIFLLAEKLISEDEKEDYLEFVTHIGKPGNNVHILRKRFKSQLEKLKSGQLKSETELDSFINLMHYLSVKTNEVQVEALRVLKDEALKYNANTSLRNSFENALSTSLESSNSEDLRGIYQGYIKSLVESSDIYKLMQSHLEEGLIHRKYDSSVEKYKNSWEVYYSVLGFVKARYNSQLSQFVSQKIIQNSEQKSDVLVLLKAYFYKKFVANVYESHKVIGKVFIEELKRLGKVEAVFQYFFRKADTFLANIWTTSFKGDMIYLEQNLSRYYEADEINEIQKILNHLDNNIRNLVMYPALFAVGYHALKQGHFDLQFTSFGGVIVHIDEKLYLRDLVDGKLPTFFKFLNLDSASALEIMLSLYFSLDQKILKAYNLDYDFIDTFVTRYTESEQVYLTNKNRQLDQFFGPNSLPQEMSRRCEKIVQGEFDFTYDRSFSSLKSYHFLGDISYYSGGIGVSTTRDMRNYLSYFNTPKIEHSLSEGMEMLRLDLGPKMNHLQIVQRALIEQGFHSQANKVSQSIERFNNQVKDLMDKSEKYFTSSIDCFYEHIEVENSMRKYFFEREINYIRSTYEALRLLEKYKDNIPDVSVVRAENPESFKMDYLKDLDSHGNFLDQLNQRWLKVGDVVKSKIVDYEREAEFRLGFKLSTSGKYVFDTNKFEDYFRRIEFYLDPKYSGVEFPIVKIQEVPQDYKQLDVLFGEDKDHYYLWEIKNTEKNFEQFAFKILSTVHNPVGNGYAFELAGIFEWKSVLMNLASLMKLQAHQYLSQDFEYKTYKNKLSQKMKDKFNYLAQLTDKIIRHMNIDETEEMILNLMQDRNFLRSSTERVNATEFFLYYPAGTLYLELGQYDIFFLSLVSYRLGEDPIFRPELFGYGKNVLLYQFLPPDSSIPNGPGIKEIEAEELIQRRDLQRFSINNSNVVKNWDEVILFDLDEESYKYIRHDLFHPIHADHALADVFVSWTREREANDVEKVPYRFDLILNQEASMDPPYIYPNILQRYRETRVQFDQDTIHAFKLNQ